MTVSDSSLPPQPRIAQEFLNAVNAEDVLGIVVRCHQIIDHLAAKVISEIVPRSEAIEVRQLSFLLKIDFCIAFHVVPESLRPVFAKLNRLRNEFAHERREKFDEQDARDLFNVVPTCRRSMFPSGPDEHPIELLRSVIAITYVETEKALERVRDQKVESGIWHQMVEEVVLPEDQYSEHVREQQKKRHERVRAGIDEAKRKRRESGEV